jgi:hypothetical protein
LRTGDAHGLQPVFYHNALDVITLAALTVELSRILGAADTAVLESGLDLFSLSRILGAAGSRDQSVTTCQRALETGLPQPVESRALRHLALQLKRQQKHELAVEAWLELSRRASPLAIEAFEELAIHYEHRRSDARTALEFTLAGIERLREESSPAFYAARFARRLERLQRKIGKNPGLTPLLPA